MSELSVFAQARPLQDSPTDPLTAAVAAHRAAYDAYQVAPEGKDSEIASDLYYEALSALVLSACTFPILTARLPAGADALLAHLRWWLAEEAGERQHYEPDFSILEARAADLAAVLGPSIIEGYASGTYPSADTDPTIEAIVAADMASVAHAASLVFRDEDDEASEALVDEALTAVDETFQAVRQSMPTTLGALYPLTKFYERDCKIYDRTGSGSGYLGHVASALVVLIAREKQGTMSITGAGS